ncbi:MAG: hypothetical protein LBG16_03305 [Elusimicrobiota bacterium]|jgi:hypothetical protein|nr:hypothetical protein [Elusimicrobiota bacterium]
MRIYPKIKHAAVCALAVAALASSSHAQKTESSFEIILSSPQQVQDFIKNNEKIFYVEDSSYFLISEDYNRKSFYLQEYIKKFFFSSDVKCGTSFIPYNGAYIKPQNVKKIRIKKQYRRIGHRRVAKDVLFYDIKFYGNGLFESRTTSIDVLAMRNLGGKPVECTLPDGKKVLKEHFTYPSSIYIPQDALAQTIDSGKLTREINKNLASAISDDNAGGEKIQKLKQQINTAFI